MSTESSTTGSLEVQSDTVKALQDEMKREQAKRAHLWKPGDSGNPAGRPQGSKNKVTLLKEAIIMDAESLVLTNWEKVVKKTIELAEDGDTQCLKILWDRVIPAKRAVEEGKGKLDKGNITINISGLEVARAEVLEVEPEAIEAEFIEVLTPDG